jgi:hypothetical protein
MIKITSKKIIPKEIAVREHDRVKQFLDPNGMFYAFEIDKEKVQEYALCRVTMTCQVQSVVDEIAQDIDSEASTVDATVITADGVVIASTSSYNDVLACVTDNSDVRVMEPADFNYVDVVLRNKYISCPAESEFIDFAGWPICFTTKF